MVGFVGQVRQGGQQCRPQRRLAQSGDQLIGQLGAGEDLARRAEGLRRGSEALFDRLTDRQRRHQRIGRANVLEAGDLLSQPAQQGVGKGRIDFAFAVFDLADVPPQQLQAIQRHVGLGDLAGQFILDRLAVGVIDDRRRALALQRQLLGPPDSRPGAGPPAAPLVRGDVPGDEVFLHRGRVDPAAG